MNRFDYLKIVNLTEPDMDSYQKYTNAYQNKYSQITYKTQELSKVPSSFKIKIAFIPCILFVVIGYILDYAIARNSLQTSILLPILKGLTVFNLVAVIISLIIPKRLYPKTKLYKDKVNEIEAQCDDLDKIYHKIEQAQLNAYNKVSNYIGIKYCYPYALQRISGYLEDGRCDDIKSALNIYEEDLHRMRMEDKQEVLSQNINSLNEQVNSCRNDIRRMFIYNMASRY